MFIPVTFLSSHLTFVLFYSFGYFSLNLSTLASSEYYYKLVSMRIESAGIIIPGLIKYTSPTNKLSGLRGSFSSVTSVSKVYRIMVIFCSELLDSISLLMESSHYFEVNASIALTTIRVVVIEIASLQP